ncbi:MAG: ABC transporter permease [Gammaproteobacteria bacterium]|nr:ABC transporter permease [Gammaproteobacteria bacterium]
MFWNNVKIAVRNLRKNKLFAFINIAGLAIGMTIYVFGGLLIKYEQSHDVFFEKSDRTYIIGAYAAPELDVGIEKMNTTFTAVGPIFKSELSAVEAVARTIAFEYLLTMGTDSFYQTIRFADPDLLQIFDFSYVHGDETALDDPSGVIITEAAAIKYFGGTDVIGEVITLNNEHDFHVTAVIEDVPQNSHFNSLPVMDVPMDVIGPIKSLSRLRDFDEAGEWNNWSMGNMTYVLLPDEFDAAWLQAQADGIYERLVPEEKREVISAFWISSLQHANVAIWDTIGMPVIAVIGILSFLVLIVACVNYTNLATAQSLGRSREVGMRKTMGAGQRQLLSQFLIESLVISGIAMLVAVAALELVIPLFNNAAGKVMTLDYLRTLPWLIATTALVGFCAGLYPAWLITRASPIDALREVARKGKKGSTVRSFMIGAQFAISAFMLAIVAIVYMQNEKVKESSYEFPRSEIYGLGRLETDGISEKLDTLRHELEALPNVDSVAYSSQVPYEQTNSTTNVAGNPGDEAGKFQIQLLRMSPEFLETYDIPLLAGRNLSRDIANDEYVSEESEVINVLVNELALVRLGIDRPEDALNQRFYDLDEEDTLREMVIVGVVPTQNIVGLFNAEKAWMYTYQPETFRMGSVRITHGNIIDTVDEIEQVWKRVIPEYPMQGRFLDEVFDDVYKILKYMNIALAGFAFVALSLALIGLFGLAAFMAAQRTKEIGVRKVLGASSTQIAKLLVWQFSKPVMWALALALPAAFFASNLYLDFFADRIESPIIILLVAGAIAVLLAWTTVAGHAFRIARANPVLALRYE